jgi:hypothetical protein
MRTGARDITHPIPGDGGTCMCIGSAHVSLGKTLLHPCLPLDCHPGPLLGAPSDSRAVVEPVVMFQRGAIGQILRVQAQRLQTLADLAPALAKFLDHPILRLENPTHIPAFGRSNHLITNCRVLPRESFRISTIPHPGVTCHHPAAS